MILKNLNEMHKASSLCNEFEVNGLCEIQKKGCCSSPQINHGSQIRGSFDIVVTISESRIHMRTIEQFFFGWTDNGKFGRSNVMSFTHSSKDQVPEYASSAQPYAKKIYQHLLGSSASKPGEEGFSRFQIQHYILTNRYGSTYC